MVKNPVCIACDYAPTCNKRVVVEEPRISVKVKDQRIVKAKCLSKAQEICQDCTLFAARRCASWKIMNGKEVSRGKLQSCPKKIPANPPYGDHSTK